VQGKARHAPGALQVHIVPTALFFLAVSTVPLVSMIRTGMPPAGKPGGSAAQQGGFGTAGMVELALSLLSAAVVDASAPGAAAAGLLGGAASGAAAAAAPGRGGAAAAVCCRDRRRIAGSDADA